MCVEMPVQIILMRLGVFKIIYFILLAVLAEKSVEMKLNIDVTEIHQLCFGLII